LGDLIGESWRDLARILAEAIGEDHDVSFCNLAIPGATVADVRRNQLSDALAHRPQVASLIVGLNDTLRSSWDPERLRQDLLHCAGELTAPGAILLTARFHDHSQVFGPAEAIGRPMARRIETLNAAYDEIQATYGGLRVDLAAHPEVTSVPSGPSAGCTPPRWGIARPPASSPPFSTSAACPSRPPRPPAPARHPRCCATGRVAPIVYGPSTRTLG
jgi:hypothetical protein